jgi:hypothetical protein
MILRAFLVWLVIIAVETVHGTLRILFIAPAVGDFRSRQIGVFIGSALILAVALGLTCWIKAADIWRLLLIGLIWVALTFVFEIALGILTGLSTERMLEDYDLTNGGLMPLGMLFMLFTPTIASRLRKCRKTS